MPRGPNWNPNPNGRPKKGTSLAERIRERVNLDELIDVAEGIMRGEPSVRVLDQKTGVPRLARMDRNDQSVERPMPLGWLKPGEVISEIVYPTKGEQLSALNWIRDSGGLKPPAQVEFEMRHADELANVEADFSKFTAAQLDAYIALSDILAGEKVKSPGERILEALVEAQVSEPGDK